jgi:hypothetical protein
MESNFEEQLLINQSLLPFPGRDENFSKNYHVSAYAVLDSDLRLGFIIRANPLDLASIILSGNKTTPKRAAELWKTTCFECFIPSTVSEGYLEFNGAPSGDWNWYAFKKYRAGQHAFPIANDDMPEQHFWQQTDNQIAVEWILPRQGIAQGFHSIGEDKVNLKNIGISVVMQTVDATLYWALQHDDIAPDFHLRSSFIYPIS